MNTEDEWRAWWESEGRNAQRLPHHDAVDHLASMTRIAWLNGAFKSADEIERLRKRLLDKWRQNETLHELVGDLRNRNNRLLHQLQELEAREQ